MFALSETCLTVAEKHPLKSLLLEHLAGVAAHHANAGQRRSPRTVEVLKFIGRQRRASIADVWTYLDTIGMGTTYNTVLHMLLEHTKAGRLQRVASGIYTLTDAGAARISLPMGA